MYVRADPNSDTYNKTDDFYNGFTLCDDLRTDCGLPWWHTESDIRPVQYGMTMDVEEAIENTQPKPPEMGKKFPDLSAIDDAYKILVPIFDLSERVHYMISEGLLFGYYLFDPSLKLTT